jgi:PPM family protein phosphatase
MPGPVPGLTMGLLYYADPAALVRGLPFMIQAHAESDTGPVRTVNEDCWLIQPEFGLFAVADGMGGHNAGEVASRLALDALSGFVSRSAIDSDLSWPYGVDPELSFQANRLRTGIHLANRRVFRAAESRDDYSGMGTTLVSLLVVDSRVIVGHVGDSRIYRLSGADFGPVTQDDSWAAALRAQGLSPEELARHPMRHVLTNVVGARDQVTVHVSELTVVPGDSFLLCSDGLYEPLSDSMLRDALAGESDVSRSAATLVRQALERGAKDNVTALVVRVGDTA